MICSVRRVALVLASRRSSFECDVGTGQGMVAAPPVLNLILRSLGVNSIFSMDEVALAMEFCYAKMFTNNTRLTRGWPRSSEV